MKKAISLLTVVFASATAIASAAPMHHGEHMGNHEMKEHHEEMKAQVETAVMNNDYEAYQTLMADKKKSGKDGMKKKRMDKDGDKAGFSDAQREERMQAHFDEQVAHYQEHGELMQKRGMPSHKRSGKHFGQHEKGIVKAALGNVSDEKLTKVIERIDTLTDKLDATDDEKIVDMLLGIREVLVAKLAE